MPGQQDELPLSTVPSTPPAGREAVGRAEGAPPRSTKTGKHERQGFFIPVSDFVWLYPEEVEVVNHPSFQRLAKVNQLGQTYLVYRGATHKRFEHVLGTVHVIQRMMEAVEHNRNKVIDRNEAVTEPLSDFEKRFIRLGALLHDIGHIAAGHTVEDELEPNSLTYGG